MLTVCCVRSALPCIHVLTVCTVRSALPCTHSHRSPGQVARVSHLPARTPPGWLCPPPPPATHSAGPPGHTDLLQSPSAAVGCPEPSCPACPLAAWPSTGHSHSQSLPSGVCAVHMLLDLNLATVIHLHFTSVMQFKCQQVCRLATKIPFTIFKLLHGLFRISGFFGQPQLLSACASPAVLSPCGLHCIALLCLLNRRPALGDSTFCWQPWDSEAS